MTEREPAKAPDGEELKIGVFVCQCGANIAAAVDTKAVAEMAARLPGVAWGQTLAQSPHAVQSCSRTKRGRCRTRTLKLPT